jgi:hypothetical protein
MSFGRHRIGRGSWREHKNVKTGSTALEHRHARFPKGSCGDAAPLLGPYLAEQGTKQAATLGKQFGEAASFGE